MREHRDKIPSSGPIKKESVRMGRTLKESKKEARKFRASFNFVLYRNKQGKCRRIFHLLGEVKAFNLAHTILAISSTL